jgi:hypothetical protein
VPELNVASVVGVDPKTLRKHYRDQLDNGQIKATAKVAESLFQKARAAPLRGDFRVSVRLAWSRLSYCRGDYDALAFCLSLRSSFYSYNNFMRATRNVGDRNADDDDVTG